MKIKKQLNLSRPITNFDSLINEGLMNEKGELFYSASRVKYTLVQTPNGYSTVFRIGIPDSASQDITSFARKELENELKYLENKNYISKYGVTGSPFVREVELSSATNSLYKSIPIAAFASFLVLLVTFRSVRYALITVMPIGLVVSWLYGIMYLGGYSLNLVTATIGANPIITNPAILEIADPSKAIPVPFNVFNKATSFEFFLNSSLYL